MTRLLPLIALFAILAVTSCRQEGQRSRPYPDRALYPVVGVDISAHNGDIDFEQVAADSVTFAIIKATEGATFKDPRFVDNLRRAHLAGLHVGAYHFFRFDVPGYMQGLNFINSVQGRDLDLPLCIDVEEWANPTNQPRLLVVARLREMIDHLEQHGYRVMLYTNKNGYRRILRGNFDTYDLWICSLVDEPDKEAWTLWQGTHNGRVNGISTPVDVNAFSGSRDEWRKWVNGK